MRGGGLIRGLVGWRVHMAGSRPRWSRQVWGMTGQRASEVGGGGGVSRWRWPGRFRCRRPGDRGHRWRWQRRWRWRSRREPQPATHRGGQVPRSAATSLATGHERPSARRRPSQVLSAGGTWQAAGLTLELALAQPEPPVRPRKPGWPLAMATPLEAAGPSRVMALSLLRGQGAASRRCQAGRGSGGCAPRASACMLGAWAGPEQQRQVRARGAKAPPLTHWQRRYRRR